VGAGTGAAAGGGADAAIDAGAAGVTGAATAGSGAAAGAGADAAIAAGAAGVTGAAIAGSGAAAGGGGGTAALVSIFTGTAGRGGATISAAIPALPICCCRPRLILARATTSGALAEMPTKLAARASDASPLEGGRPARLSGMGLVRVGPVCWPARCRGAAVRERTASSWASSLTAMLNPPRGPEYRQAPRRKTPRQIRPA
jgi:hypothetical protein